MTNLTMKDTSTDDLSETSQSTTTKSKTKKVPSDCKICGAPALYSYFSVVACDSCKIFFRRYAQTEPGHFKCRYDGHCEINVNTRHICIACRRAKCLACGMQVHMIRATRTVKNKTSEKRKATTTSTVSAIPKENVQPEQLPTLNFLQGDQSTLTSDEWTLVSNITHCYDERSGCTAAEGFIQKQNELPLKMRFRTASVVDFYKSLMIGGQHLYERNIDFISLLPHDRSILLNNTVKYVAVIGSCLVGRATHILDNPAFYESAENIYGSNILSTSIRALDLMDADGTYAKLVLSLLTFSTFHLTNYTNNDLINLEDVNTISQIQDRYADLAWRYVVYKCGPERAVMGFSNLIRCIFALDKAFLKAVERTKYMDIVDSLIKQTEEIFSLTE